MDMATNTDVHTEQDITDERNTKAGYKKTKLGWIPKEWKVRSLGEISIIKGDYGINAAAVNYNYKLPTYIRITDIGEDGKFLSENKKSVDNEESSKFILAEGDIVFARTGASVGKTYRHVKSNGNLVFAGFLIRFRINIEKASATYIELFTRTHTYKNWIRTYSVRSGQPGINSKEYCKLKIPLPPLPEQQKIAQILSTWDKAIALQEKLITEKQQLKKGLMQQLLTGKKRFPGFDGEWEEVRLKDIGKIVTGSTPKTKEKDNYNGRFLFVSPVDLGKSKSIDSTIKTLSKKGFDSGRKIPKESILFVCIGSTIGKIGVSGEVLITNQQINSIIPKSNYNTDFIYYQLLRESKRIRLLSGEQAVPMINKSDFSIIKILITSLNEQQKIAAVLSNMDIEIEKMIDYKNSLIQQKKGLMQQLLTGEKRVKI